MGGDQLEISLCLSPPLLRERSAEFIIQKYRRFNNQIFTTKFIKQGQELGYFIFIYLVVDLSLYLSTLSPKGDTYNLEMLVIMNLGH